MGKLLELHQTSEVIETKRSITDQLMEEVLGNAFDEGYSEAWNDCLMATLEAIIKAWPKRGDMSYFEVSNIFELLQKNYSVDVAQIKRNHLAVDRSYKGLISESITLP